jgi:hypothetical protein
MSRVASGAVVVFSVELDGLPRWQLDYFGEYVEDDRVRIGTAREIQAELGGRTRVEKVPTPASCRDGFVEAYWNRPEAFLDPEVRAGQSIWARLGPDVEDAIVARLRADLESGAWEEAHGHLRAMAEFDGGLRLIVSEP